MVAAPAGRSLAFASDGRGTGPDVSPAETPQVAPRRHRALRPRSWRARPHCSGGRLEPRPISTRAWLRSETLGAGDAVIVLEHQHKIANPVLVAALRSEVGYVGALGSRRMRDARVRLLRDAGATDDQLAALHCPTGLDLGARTPAESAVSIVAEIIATRSGRDPQPLRTTTNRIGV